jgi:hypothetical protein
MPLNLFCELFFVINMSIEFLELDLYRVSRKWRTHNSLPDRGCLNVHEKNMEKNFQTKKSIIAKMIVQYKQRYTQIQSVL